jgi:chromate transporter
MRDNPLIALIIIIAPLSLAAVGGASSIYAPLQRQTVDVYQWFSGREFVEMFAIARVTPGPGSLLTTLIGWRIAGVTGALVATLALYVPSTVLCYGAAQIWRRYRGTRVHTAIESGLRPIAAGLMLAGGLAILRVDGMNPLAWAVAGAATAVLFWRPLLHPLLVLAGGAVAFIAARAVMGGL